MVTLYTSLTPTSHFIQRDCKVSITAKSVGYLIAFLVKPFGQPPTGDLRWEPPKPFLSQEILNATALSPSCLQQIPFAFQNLSNQLSNTTSPTGESEDCLFL
jgi:carboxylesterase type B